MTTPVVFLVFNRPDLTARVFERIRQARPKALLVVADGPREDRLDDAGKCREVQNIVTRGVDWPCELLVNSSDRNLGCRQRVASGLDWAFELVEEAIILEDDCLPDPTFFPFCKELLSYYRSDERVWSISGDSFLPETFAHPYSYRFSRIAHVWGWATWRRAWKHYDVSMRDWPAIRAVSHSLAALIPNPTARRSLVDAFDSVYEEKVDTWDFQWTFASLSKNGVHIAPLRNLISNLGFSAEATHTVRSDSVLSGLPTRAMPFPLLHPPSLDIDEVAENQTFQIGTERTLAARLREPGRALKRVAGAVLKSVKFGRGGRGTSSEHPASVD